MSKSGFLDIFFKIGHQKFLIFCIMVEGNRMHLWSMVPYLRKIIIRGLLGYLVGIKHFMRVFQWNCANFPVFLKLFLF